MGSNQHKSATTRRAELAASRAQEDAIVRSSAGTGEAFASVVERRISRRGLLKPGYWAACMSSSWLAWIRYWRATGQAMRVASERLLSGQLSWF